MADDDLTTRGTPRQRAATPKRVKANERAATVHGAYSYLTRMASDALITVTMSDVEKSVMLEVETDGPRERVKKQAARFGTAAELLWGHMQTSPEAFESGLQKWGWLAGAEVRAWRDWHAMRGTGDRGQTLDELMRGNADDD